MRPRFGLAKWAWVLHSGHATTFLLWGETFVDLYRTHGVSLQSNRSVIESLEGFLVETVIWRVISLTKTLVRSERIEHDGHKKQPVSLCAKSFLQSWTPFSVIRPQYLRPHGFGGYFSVLFGKYGLWFKVVVLIPDMENNRIDVAHSRQPHSTVCLLFETSRFTMCCLVSSTTFWYRRWLFIVPSHKYKALFFFFLTYTYVHWDPMELLPNACNQWLQLKKKLKSAKVMKFSLNDKVLFLLDCTYSFVRDKNEWVWTGIGLKVSVSTPKGFLRVSVQLNGVSHEKLERISKNVTFQNREHFFWSVFSFFYVQRKRTASEQIITGEQQEKMAAWQKVLNTSCRGLSLQLQR